MLAAVLALLLWPAREHKIFCAATCVLVLAGAFGVYRFVGNPEVVPMVAEYRQKMETVKTALSENAVAVRKNPKNLPAWIALGQAFMETGQWKSAADAFRQAVVLSNGDPRLILAYARALIFVDEGKVGDGAKKSLEMVILQDKENAEARYFLAVRKLQDGDNEAAMKEMKTLYRSLPENSPLKRMIDAQIGR